MAKRSKEEREEERKKELLRTLRRGPDLDRFIDEKKRNFVSYAQGARMYSMNYYSFVKLAKEAGANIRIKKNVVIDLELIDKYLENNPVSRRDWIITRLSSKMARRNGLDTMRARSFILWGSTRLWIWLMRRRQFIASSVSVL